MAADACFVQSVFYNPWPVRVQATVGMSAFFALECCAASHATLVATLVATRMDTRCPT